METVSMNASETNQNATAQSAALPNEIMAALGYFCGIGAILALVIEPYRSTKSSRFHAIQSLLFGGTFVVAYMAAAIVTFVLSMMAKLVLGSLGLYAALGVLLGIPAFIYGMLALSGFCVWVYLIVRSAMGHKVTLPVIGPMAERMSSASAGSKA